MDISTQHGAEGKTKVLSFLFRCVGHILYILIKVLGDWKRRAWVEKMCWKLE